MANQTNSKAKALLGWMDARFPLSKMWNEHLAQYYAPKNFNFWYYFGSLALLVLVIQIVSGIFLTMNYKPDGNLNAYHLPAAFTAVEYIMRDVSGGWIIRYMHSTGASFFFIVVYLHMFRGLIYGSYKKPAIGGFSVPDFLGIDGRSLYGLPCCLGVKCPSGVRRSLLTCSPPSLLSVLICPLGYAVTSTFPTLL